MPIIGTNQEYTDNQITRLCLNGSGIICGLDIYIDENQGITITSGNGLTSDGTYISLPQDKTFRYYSDYAGAVNYPPFSELSSIWRLLEEPNGNPLKPQNSEEELNPFLRDKVVVAFLEEQTGASQMSLQFLLLNQNDVLQYLDIMDATHQLVWEGMQDDDDFIYGDDYNPNDTRPRVHTLNLAINPALQLPELHLRRLGFSIGDPFNCPPEGVDASVFPVIQSLDDLYQAYIPVIDDATRALDKALTKLHKDFQGLLDLNKEGFAEEIIELLCAKWEAFKRENNEGLVETKYYIQYFYGWVRDLIQAYNELRSELINLVAACCSDTDAFPRHLLLGIALRDDLARQPKPLRTIFRQPPIYNGNANRVQCFRLYCWRVLMMIRGFYLPNYISDSKLNPYQSQDIGIDFKVLKITPGRFYNMELGLQSIPYYYPVTYSRFSVHHFWNCERTRTCSTDQILSYHASDFDDSYSLQHHVVRPLHYKLDQYPFFRIEGYINQPLNDIAAYESMTDADGNITYEPYYQIGVINRIKHLKQKYNLPFSFRAVNVQDLMNLMTDNEQAYAYELPNDLNDTLLSMLAKRQLRLEEGLPERYNSFAYNLLGQEHLAGVKEGGTFIIVYEEQPIILLTQNGEEATDSNGAPLLGQIAIADFYLPCCTDDATLSAPLIDLVTNDSETGANVVIEGLVVQSSSLDTDELIEQEIDRPNITSLIAVVGNANPSEKDDLKKITGIGPKYEERLNAMGIYTYRQIGNMKTMEYNRVAEFLGIAKGKPKKENWAGQAKELLMKREDE